MQLLQLQPELLEQMRGGHKALLHELERRKKRQELEVSLSLSQTYFNLISTFACHHNERSFSLVIICTRSLLSWSVCTQEVTSEQRTASNEEAWTQWVEKYKVALTQEEKSNADNTVRTRTMNSANPRYTHSTIQCRGLIV